MSAASAVAAGLFKSPEVVYLDAYEGRQFDAVYFAMLIFACLIALMGLLLNSPAVIIGAMLISPLMGPILSCGLALTTAEWPLGKKAARNLVLSVVEVILVAVLATHLSPLREATSEILARTNPNLMDLLIAFFSGLAGTVALASRRTAFTILPGVAIATAVMPPLATVGYGIATHQWAVARGAFMLFFTNFTAIVLSASLVFLVIGIRPRSQGGEESHRLLIRWRIAIAAAVLLLISIPLMRTLIHAANEAGLRRQVRDALQESIVARHDGQLDSVHLQMHSGRVDVGATIQTSHYIESAEIKNLEATLAARVGTPVRLQVQQLQLAQKAPSTEEVIHDFLAAGLIQPPKPEKPAAPAAQIADLQQHIEHALQGLVAPAGMTARVTSVGKTPEGAVLVNASAQAPQLTGADVWTVAAVAMSNDLSAPVDLRVTVAAPAAGLALAYHRDSSQLAATELRRLRRFEAALGKDVGLTLAASSDIDPALAGKRSALLRKLLARPLVDFRVPAPTAANTLAVVPVQTIAATSTPPAQPAPSASQPVQGR